MLLKPRKKDGALDEAGQYTVVHAHMDHLAASSAIADIAGRAKKVSINYRWKLKVVNQRLTFHSGTFICYAFLCFVL